LCSSAPSRTATPSTASLPANRADALRGFDRVVFPRQFDSRAIVRHEHRRLWIAHDVGRLRGRIDQLDSLADDAEFDWRNRVPVIASLPQLSIDFFDVYQRHLLLYTTSTAFGLPCVAMLRDFADLVLQRIAPHALTVTAPQRGTHAKEAVFFSHPLFTAQQRAHTVNLDTLAVTVDSGVTCRRDGKLFDIGEHVTVEHHTVTSRNGVDVVEVPMIIVRAHDTPVDGTGKCLQLVYGAYGDTWPFRLGFVELEAVLSDGWTLALCGVRGGGELGSNWADEGSGEKRDNSFIDAAACGKWLIQRGYAARDSLCIGGRSAGAFVAMGAVAREPTLYAVLIGIKPLVDPGGDGSQLTATDLRLWGSFRPLEVLPLVAERVGGAFPSIWMHATAADEHAPVEAVEALVEALYDEELGEEEMHMRVRFRPAKNGAHDEAESREVLADLFAFATMEVARRRELKEEQTTALER
jgi:protease II